MVRVVSADYTDGIKVHDADAAEWFCQAPPKPEEEQETEPVFQPVRVVLGKED